MTAVREPAPTSSVTPCQPGGSAGGARSSGSLMTSATVRFSAAARSVHHAVKRPWLAGSSSVQTYTTAGLVFSDMGGLLWTTQWGSRARRLGGAGWARELGQVHGPSLTPHHASSGYRPAPLTSAQGPADSVIRWHRLFVGGSGSPGRRERPGDPACSRPGYLSPLPSLSPSCWLPLSPSPSWLLLPSFIDLSLLGGCRCRQHRCVVAPPRRCVGTGQRPISPRGARTPPRPLAADIQ